VPLTYRHTKQGDEFDGGAKVKLPGPAGKTISGGSTS
jgi:hypothetical protein